MNYYMAIDIGGTHLRVATYREDGITPVEHKRIATRSKDSTPVERMVALIKEQWPTDGEVKAIAVAAPGYLDPQKGIIISAPNIAGWANLPLRDQIESEVHAPVLLGNDANLAALGEWTFGAGQGEHDIIYLTISTGIGAGVICNDHLITGSRGMATELGHITVMENGPLCGCGFRGHLEAVASGTAIARDVMEKLKAGEPSILPMDPPPTTKEIGLAAKKGDRLSIEALAYAGRVIGHALADFLVTFNPSMVIFGGGVSMTGDFLFKPIENGLKERIITPEYLVGLKITSAALGDDAGLLGALALARTVDHK
jgi:glucokinase